jgi:hypothetical protein
LAGVDSDEGAAGVGVVAGVVGGVVSFEVLAGGVTEEEDPRLSVL